ncbi:MAG: hypothetical protein H6810_06560 [Phycisphaeraceae bacterium]|nr:MAG: hypothetical protein H6810_06560 [Phycisphaeraceae bacterium]
MIHQPIVAGVWRLMYQSRYPLLVPAFVARLCDGVSESLIAAVCVLGPLIVLLARPIRDRVRLVGVSISIVGFIGTHVAFAWFSGARSWMPDFETRGGAVAPFLLLLVFVPVSLVAMYLANLIVERRSRASAIPDPSPVSLA